MNLEIWLGRLLLVALICLSVDLGWTGLRTPTRASRRLTYVADDGVVLKVAGDGAVELGTWLSSPVMGVRDARATRPVRLELEALDRFGAVVRRRSAWVRYRRGRALTDSEVRTPAYAAQGRTDELSPLWGERNLTVPSSFLEGAESLRVHPERLLTTETLLLTASQGDPEDGATRLSATPPRGRIAHPTQPVMVADPGMAWDHVAALGMPVMPGGAVALNVATAQTLDLTWHDATGAPSDPVPTEIRWVALGEATAPTRQAASSLTLPHSGGVASLQVALGPDADGPRVLRVRAAKSGGAPFGHPSRIEDASVLWIGPELHTLDAFRTGPDLAPLQFTVTPGEAVRLSVRRRTEAPLPGLLAEPAAVRTRLVVTLRDEEGTETRLERLLEARPSVFERYVQGDHPVNGAPSEAAHTSLRIPDGVTELEVETDPIADVQLRVRDARETEGEPQAGYTLPDEWDGRLRFRPWVERRWHLRIPRDHEALALDNRLVRIDAQVRLEPRTAPREPLPRGRLALRRPYQRLVEPAGADTAADSLGVRTRVSGDAWLTVPPQGRLWFDYRVPAERVGDWVPIRVGDETVQHQLSSVAGSFGVTAEPGTTQVHADFPGILLARAPGAPAWRVRAAYAVAPGRRLRVPVRANGELAVFPYSTEGVVLGWTVELDEAPPALIDTMTEDEAVLHLPVDAERVALGLSSPLGALRRARGAVLALGEDRQGWGHVHLTNLGDRTVYLRFAASWTSVGVANARNTVLRGRR